MKIRYEIVGCFFLWQTLSFYNIIMNKICLKNYLLYVL